uniref:Uncharacterized protein n=1 Tax=Branchiostoma floridae TaxID=7739 RepID=C3ZHL1_BRAFL|eukprot:XP_002591995.1 hypothetical protein BRAFLDRAFT_122381 [Branchiostoma floridae]
MRPGPAFNRRKEADKKTVDWIIEEVSGRDGEREARRGLVKEAIDAMSLFYRYKKLAAKNKVKYRFAVEVARRLEAEHSKGLERFGTRRRVEMERAMERAMEAIPSCYGGDHSLCKTHSLVCRHPKTWKPSSLSKPTRGNIKLNASDRKELHAIMQHRLGKTGLEKTRKGTNSNKCESVNRRISKSQPKNLTRSRTLAGRLASAIHSSNNGVGLSIAMKRYAAGIPLSKHSPTVRVLQKMMKRQRYKRAYKKEEGTKTRARMNVVKKFNAYDETREQGTYKSTEEDAGKGRRRSARRRVPRVNTDHMSLIV